MIRGIRYTGPESDIWSLGVIMFAMLSGCLPFDAQDRKKLYEKILSGVFRCPTSFSPGRSHHAFFEFDNLAFALRSGA
jgi:MAP/microtubule affinity-regulating kinase